MRAKAYRVLMGVAGFVAGASFSAIYWGHTSPHFRSEALFLVLTLALLASVVHD